MIATLIVKSGPLAGRRFDVQAEVIIGREDADMTIGDPQISRRHAQVRPTATGVQIEDAGSSNGTFVNGNRISSATDLKNGDVVRVGETQLEVEIPQGTAVAGHPGGRAVAGPPQGTVVAPKEPAGAGAAPTGGPPTGPAARPPAATPPPAAAPPPYTPPTPTPPLGQGPTPYSPPGQGPPRYGPPTGPGPAYAPPTGPQYAAPVHPKQVGKPPSSGSKAWLIALIIGLVVLLAGAAVFFFVIKESDEEQIRATLEEIAQNPNEADTCELFSQSFKEGLTGETGSAAETACRDQFSSASDPDSNIKVATVEINGDSADVRASIDGNLGIIKMVNEDGDWVVDDFENL